jgi:hypothetical protein
MMLLILIPGSWKTEIRNKRNNDVDGFERNCGFDEMSL